MKTGRVTVSDRASAGIYEDRSGPEIENVLREVFGMHIQFVPLMVPDETPLISSAIKQLADEQRCELIVTTGGTGISARDVTPEATRAILDKELPGFGEIMRIQSFAKVKTSILSRAVAGTRGQSLIVNLPGKPTAVRECLEILAPAISEVIAHLRGEDPHSQRSR
jgi:molybdopterin adenylyltransferase